MKRLLVIASLSAFAVAGQEPTDRLTQIVQEELVLNQELKRLQEEEKSCDNLSEMADLAMLVPEEELAGALQKTDLMKKMETCEEIYKAIQVTDTQLKSLSLEKALIREAMKESSVRSALSNSRD